MVKRVCVSVRGRMPTLLDGPGCNFGECYGMPPSCELLGGFAIGLRCYGKTTRTRNVSEYYMLVLVCLVLAALWNRAGQYLLAL